MKKLFLQAGAILLGLCVCGSLSAAEWSEKPTKHFIIYYKNAPYGLVASVALRAEKRFKDITDKLGFPYPQWWADNRMKLYIYDDRKDYQDSNSEVSHTQWSAGMASYKDRWMKAYALEMDSFLDGVLPHELTHLLMYDFVGTGADIPPWFCEGLAVSQEDRGRLMADRAAKKHLMEDGRLALADLKEDNKGSLDDYYLISSSAVHFILASVPGKIRMLLEGLKDGRTFSEALSDTSNGRFGDLNELNERWVAYLRKGEFES